MSDPFLKVKLGRYDGKPAVVLTDRAGVPFLWCVGATHRAVIKRMREFCDEQERDRP